MTFVRAEKFAAGVHLMADWRVTHVGAAHPPSFLTGTLKAWILNPGLAIAYAGDVASAVRCLREVRGPAANRDIAELLILLEDSSWRNGVDYALAIADGSRLFKVVDGSASPVQELWLGEASAWEAYQRVFTDETPESPEGSLTLPPDIDHVSASGRNRMNAAFDKLIREGGIESVGELAIAVRADGNRFRYAPAAFVGGGFASMTPHDGVPTLVDFGTAETGLFNWALLPCDDAPAVAVYFSEARFGAVFYPAVFEEPVTARGASMSEFIGRAYDETGLRFEHGIEYLRQSIDE